MNGRIYLLIILLWLTTLGMLYSSFKHFIPHLENRFLFLLVIIFILSTLLFACCSYLIYITKIKKTPSLLFLENEKSDFSSNEMTEKQYHLFYDMTKKMVSDAYRNNKIFAMMVIEIEANPNVRPFYIKPLLASFIEETISLTNNILRAGDMVAHVEKNKFIVILSDLKQAKFAGHIAEKLLNATAKLSKKNHLQSSLLINVGISIYPEDGKEVIDLHKKTLVALHKSKQLKLPYFYYQEKMNNIAQEHSKLRHILHRAIKNNELILNFQAQLSLATNQVNRVEALVRLNDSEIGKIAPDFLIPFAEEIGIITELGDWVLNEACKQCKKWHNEGYKISVSVNISHKQFYSDELFKTIQEILKKHHLEGKYVELEITETVIMDDINAAIDRLQKLQQLGVKIAIDDFGTGYTSINHLKKLPIHVLKIDKSFIHDLPHNKHDVAITLAIISLSHNLGIEVVAEGVEKDEQLAFLKVANCDFIQGYLVSKPISQEEIIKLFAYN